MGLLLAATLVVIALSYGYLQLHFEAHEEFEEFYLLVLLATFGGLVLVSARHFVSLFLGLELIGVSLYSLIGYLRIRRGPLEAALKYLLLSASASAFLLFGIALMYFQTGTMAFGRMGGALGEEAPALWLAGFVLALVGLGFKLGLVPFHLWIPDVYQGAPAPITAYVATVSKGAVFALLLRFVSDVQALQHGALGVLFGLLAAASMIAGNVLALLQHNVKRLLAYSSIAHLGYLLVALLAGGSLALEAVTFYLIAYFIMTLGAFGIVTILSRESRDADMLEDYRGLFWSRPWLAGTLTLMLLSLAGIPVTVGFVGKFYAITAGLDARLWFLVLLLVANSAIGVYYYLRLIVAMFEQPVWIAGRPAVRVETRTGWTTVLSLGLMVSLLLWLGLYPEPMIDFIRIMVGPLASPVAAIPS
jgi:NADH-quinone oxidoreductase subunit N